MVRDGSVAFGIEEDKLRRFKGLALKDLASRVEAVAIPDGAGPKTRALLQRQNTAEQGLSDQRARVEKAQTRIQQLQDDSIAKGVTAIVKFEKPTLIAPVFVSPASLSVPVS